MSPGFAALISLCALIGVVLLFGLRALVLRGVPADTCRHGAPATPAFRRFRVRAFAKTDVGKRKNNEDSSLVLPELNGDDQLSLLAVADGVGGHASGEEASGLAVEALDAGWKNSPPAGDQTLEDWARAVLPVCDKAVSDAAADPAKKGMGTTVVLAVRRGRDLLVANVGDSRAYLWQNGKIHRLSKDHTFVQRLLDAGSITPEQAKNHPHAHVITAHLGGSLDHLDVCSVKLEDNAVLLLCSDGLTDVLEDEVIGRILAAHVGNPEAAANELVGRALAAGTRDNVTVVVADFSAK